MMFVSAFGYCYAVKFLLLDEGIPLSFIMGSREKFFLITQIIFYYQQLYGFILLFSLNEPSQTKWFL